MALGSASQGAGSGATSVTQGTSPWIVDVFKVGGASISLGQALATASLPVVAATAEQTGLSAGSLNADLVPSTNVSAFKSWSLQVLGAFSGTLTFQGSNDNTNWISVQGVYLDRSTDTQTTTTTGGTGIWSGTIGYKYFRVRMTSYSSGTATGVLELYSQPNPNHYMGVGAAQYGSWVVGGDTASGSTDANNPVKVGAKYNSTKPTFTDGQRGDLQIGSRGSLQVQIMGVNNVNSPIADTGAAIPANAFAVGGSDGTLLQMFRTANGDSTSAGQILEVVPGMWNGSNVDRQKELVNAVNSTGTGYPNTGLLGQFDDTSPTAITENSFGNLRISTNRNLYNTIRDAAGNERGLNVASTGNISVDTVTTLTNQSQEGGVNISLNAGTVDTGTRRVIQANGSGKTILSAGGSAASNGNNTLVSAGTNKLKVFAFSLSTVSTTAMTCIFQSGASGTELWRVVLQAVTGTSAGANLAISPPGWLFATASATLLNLNLSSANAVHWSVSYYDEA